MSILAETRTPQFYAAVFTTPPEGYWGYDFQEGASLLVALAATMPGYLGYLTEQAAENRTVAVCYWDNYAALSEWQKKSKDWISASLDPDTFVCTTGCLWPWLADKRPADLEAAARSVA